MLMFNRLVSIFKNDNLVEKIGLTVLIIFSFALRFSAINPPALWYDDLWVGLISRVQTWNDFLLVKAVSPPLFLVLEWLAIKFIPDKEISVQFFPIIFGLLQIPIFYFLLKKITDNKWLAFLGAIILAISSKDLLVYSARAKHYSLDSLSSILLLFYYIRFFSANIEIKRVLFFLILSFILFLGSFTSIIIAGILVHILLFRIIKDCYKNKTFSVKPELLIIIFDIFVFLVYSNFLRTNIDEDIYEYWRVFFIDIHQSFFNILLDAIAKLGFFVMAPFWSIYEFFANKTGEYVFLILIFDILFLGVIYLYKRKLFDILFFVAAFYLVAIFMSMMRIYPMSGGRVDIYSYPITILLGVCGIWQLVLFLKFNQTFQKVFFIYAYSMFFALSFFYFQEVQYPYNTNVKNYVNIIEQNTTEKDAVLLAPYSDYSFAYYTDWPIKFAEYKTATGFIPIIAKDNVFALPSTGVSKVDTDKIKKYMEYFLSKIGDFDRVYFFSSHCFDEDQRYKNYVYRKYIQEKILENNFKLIDSSKEENTCFLKIYQKNDFSE